jgi:hypothetical protein
MTHEETMSDKHLKLTPHKLADDPTAWWYEEEKGLCVVQQYLTNRGTVFGTRSVVIPWGSIRAALTRKDKP